MKDCLLNPTSLALFSTFALASCGPEMNSRFGDANWDPSSTQETLDPIDPPEFEVVFRDNTPDNTSDNDFTALITLEFEELNRRASASIVPEFERGNASAEVIDDWVTADESNSTDTRFWLDLEHAEDKRLTVSTPGDYTLIMDFDVIWPNGNSVAYKFDDMTFTLPGCVDSFTFFNDYINKPLSDNCVACHRSGAAQTAMDLSSSNLTTRRNVFLNQIEDGPSEEGFTGNVLDFIVSNSHPGAANAASLPTSFSSYATILINRETADSSFDAATNFDLTEDEGSDFCFARPTSAFVIES